MKLRSVGPIRTAKISCIVLSAGLCLAGLAMILHPDISLRLLNIGFGLALMLFGIVRLAGYLSKDLYRLAFQFDLPFGILLMLLGLVMIVRSRQAAVFGCVMLGVTALVDGLFRIQMAREARDFGVKSWWVILLLAVVTAAAGLLAILHPTESSRVLIIFLGCAVLTEGLLNLCVLLTTVKIIRHQRPDVIDMEYPQADACDTERK